ncbi:unnamed protein product [Aphanomyces euteiches]
MPTNQDAVHDVPQPGLYKRKDFLETDEAAKNHPNRTYYYRKEADIEKVIDSCTKKLAVNPSDATTIAIRGASHLKKMEWAHAVDDFSQVLKLVPNDANAYYNRGIAWSNINELQKAIEDLTHALLLNPNHVNAAYARASCYNKQGDFSRAIEDYHFALMKDQQIAKNKAKSKPTPPKQTAASSPSSMSLGVDAYAKQREKEILDSMNNLKLRFGFQAIYT